MRPMEHPENRQMGGVMSRTEVVDIAMPDGTVINAEVLVSDSISDVSARSRLNLDEAKESIASFVRWAVSSLGIPADDDAKDSPEWGSSPPGMRLGRVGLEFGLKLAVKTGTLTSVIAAVGGEATAVIRLEWERFPASGSPR
jgi:hypothetical protein